MQKSSLIELIKTFTKPEMKDFGEFVNSPFFNKNKSVNRLYTYLKKYHAEFPAEKIEKEIVYLKVFNNAKYNDAVMRSTMFRLQKLGEDFIAYRHFKTNGVDEKKALLKELRNRSVDKLFLKKYNEADREVENSGGISSDYFWNKLELNSVFYDYHSARARSGKTLEEIVTRSSEILLCYFLNESKPLIGIVQNNIYNNNAVAYSPLAEYFKSIKPVKFLEEVNKSNSNYPDIIKLNYYLINCSIDINDDNSYEQAKNLLYKNIKIFSKAELYNIFSGLKGFVWQKSLLSRDKYQGEYFELMRHMIEAGAYNVFGEVMSFTVFDNMLTTALALKKIEYAEKFVKKYGNYLIPSSRDNMLLYANARLAFEKGDYDTALECCSKVNIEYFMMKIRIRVITLKIYYERKQYEAALNAIDTFRHFLKNSKNLTSARVSNYDNFNKILNQIIKYRTNPSYEKLEEIKDKIKYTPNVSSKEWLREKIEELGKQIRD